MTWLAFALLGVGVVASLWPRRYHRTHPRAGQYYCYPVFALLAASAALFILLAHWFHVYAWASVLFWLIWIIALCVVTFNKRNDGFWPAFLLSVLAWTLILLPFGSTVFQSAPSAPTAQALTVEMDGKTRQLDFVSSADASKPLAGKDVNTETTPPSLDDGKGPVHSWTELVQRVNGLPKAKKDAYIAAINARSRFLGTWDDVQQYAAMEKKDDLDTRVVLIINSTVTDKEARDAVRTDVGDATDKLPIVRVSGALVNTRGVDAGKIEDFADGRSQIRVILTTPVVKKDGKDNAKPVANTDAASKGTGVLTECTNPSTGIVRHPTPHTVPPKKTSPPPSVPPTTPSTTPPTTRPPTTTPPTTTPPTTTPPTTTPPTTTPPTTTPPTTTPPTTTPPTTTPPTTTPPTTTPPTTTPPTTTPPEETPTKGPVPYPTDKPGGNKTPDPVETTAPVEHHPADPTTKPGDEAPDVPADGATHQPTAEPTQPPASHAPTDDAPGGTPSDPDGNALAGLGAVPLLGLGLRRRILGG